MSQESGVRGPVPSDFHVESCNLFKCCNAGNVELAVNLI